MTFERTEDLDLVREILTDPRCWRRMTDDRAPEREEFRVNLLPDVEYVIGRVDGRPVALFLLIERTSRIEVHFCFRPEAWGQTVEIAKAFVEWVWRETDYSRLIGPVPSHNRLALRLAEKCGFRELNRIPNRVYRRGKPYDVILMGIERPQ